MALPLDPAALARWQKLYQVCTLATPFQSPGWLNQLYQRHKKGEPMPLFLDDGFAPLIRARGTIRLAGGDYEDILAVPGHEKEVVCQLLQKVRSIRGWQMLKFRALREDGVLLTGWRESPPPDLAWQVTPYREYLVVNLPATWAEYEKQIGKKLAYKMRAAAGRRDRTFASHEIRRATAETLDEDLDALFELHDARWQARGLEGVFREAGSKEAFRMAAHELLKAGSLWLYTLWLDGKPAGAQFCLIDSNAIYHYIGGIDVAFQKHHPGKVLIARAIQDGIEGGLKTFDFLSGVEGYKEDWANDSVPVFMLIAGRGPLGWMIVRLFTPISTALRRRSEERGGRRSGTRVEPEPAGTLDE